MSVLAGLGCGRLRALCTASALVVFFFLLLLLLLLLSLFKLLL